MRKLILFVSLCSLSLTAIAQNRQAIMVEGEWAQVALKDFATLTDGTTTTAPKVEMALSHFVTNYDICPYYLSIDLSSFSGFRSMPSSPYITTVQPGIKKKLHTMTRDETPQYNNRYKYSYYRGDVAAEIDINYPYALPIRQGDTTKISIGRNSGDYTLLFDMSYTVDTVYACRAGIVCNDELSDQSSKGHNKSRTLITIYHKDGSMAEYTQFSQSLVRPGDRVKPGDPIAICSSDNRMKQVCVGIFFLDKNKVAIATGNKHSHFRPFFHEGAAGSIQLEPETSYTATITEELIIRDMDSKELKKYRSEQKKQNKK